MLRQRQAGDGAEHENQQGEPEHVVARSNLTGDIKQQACQNSPGTGARGTGSASAPSIYYRLQFARTKKLRPNAFANRRKNGQVTTRSRRAKLARWGEVSLPGFFLAQD